MGFGGGCGPLERGARWGIVAAQRVWHRARLISDVVTGKLDVRGVALPELDQGLAPDEGDAGEEPDEDATPGDGEAEGGEE